MFTVAVHLLLAATIGGKCTVHSDCNLNGKCLLPQGSCKCLAAWKGDTCGVLNLAPAVKGAGLHAENQNMSSWGGAVAFDASSGKWLMYAAEMVGGCGINSWESNSQVVRASSLSLDLPFTVDAVVKPAFGSEPSLAQTADGKWLLYSIGNSSSARNPRPDCSQGYTPKVSAVRNSFWSNGCHVALGPLQYDLL